VVLAIGTSTVCQNCHDEAQYLVHLDKKDRDTGLTIVALASEAPGEPGRERAFVKQHGAKYAYLIAGAPCDMREKVPQLLNLNTWPATVFICREGGALRLRLAGKRGVQHAAEGGVRRETLLAEKPPVERAAAAPSTSRAAADVTKPMVPPQGHHRPRLPSPPATIPAAASHHGQHRGASRAVADTGSLV
jgi:hypothetical protein